MFVISKDGISVTLPLRTPRSKLNVDREALEFLGFTFVGEGNEAPKRKQRHENEFGDEKFVDAKASKKILRIGQELADEDEAEEAKNRPTIRNVAFEFEGVRDESEEEEEDEGKFGDEAWGDEEERVIETYNLMSSKLFTHASPTLFNAGTPQAQLSSCFLVDMKDDSIDGIYDTLKTCAMISKMAGGIGLNIHRIRATGSYIAGTMPLTYTCQL